MAIKTRNGTANNDTLTGTTGIDWFYGLDGNDLLRGDKGNDFLSGGNGNDTLEGGIGADTLHGGTGSDIFLYKSIVDAKIDPINSQEQINDFSVGDKIDFSAITTRHFIGNEEFNGIVGEIRYGYSYGYNYGLNAMDNIDVIVMGMMGMSSKNSASLQMDSDGDAVADIQIAVKQINNTKAINLVETSTNSGVFILATEYRLCELSANRRISDEKMAELYGNVLNQISAVTTAEIEQNKNEQKRLDAKEQQKMEVFTKGNSENSSKMDSSKKQN